MMWKMINILLQSKHSVVRLPCCKFVLIFPSCPRLSGGYAAVFVTIKLHPAKWVMKSQIKASL